MILDLILYIIYGFVYGITYPLRLFSDVSLPSDVATAISNAGIYVSNANMVFPISDFATILGSVVGIELAIFTYKLIMWTIKRLPTQS